MVTTRCTDHAMMTRNKLINFVRFASRRTAIVTFIIFCQMLEYGVSTTPQNIAKRPHLSHENVEVPLLPSTAFISFPQNAFPYPPSTFKMVVDENDPKRKDQNDDPDSIDEKIDSFLDKPFFDPENPNNNDNWFANLVKNDYDTAEALYVGAFLTIMVIVSQELLRIVKYGDMYVPFGGGGGKLF
mmetsp:Transcript_18619/g.38965  ORF Transcript_18619/g.38965 Transcript_18619/m.38965 type:complete len:185 (+) Transcript_18619:109-663(+)